MALLLSLMIFATFNDVKRWFVQPEITQPEGAADGNQPPVKP